jgi:hypothetical protein
MRELGLPLRWTIAGVMLVAGACAPLDAVSGGAPSPGYSVVEGEVRALDARRGLVEVRDMRNRAHRLHFDRSTRVVYRQREYQVLSLERGDRVRVQVSRGRNGEAWADRIDVRESVRERGRVAARVERLDGRVLQVDHRRGFFTVQQDRQAVAVYLAPRVSSGDARRFDRLRRGDRVRGEVVWLGRGAAELVRFR